MKKLILITLIIAGGFPFSCEERGSTNNTKYEIKSLSLKAGKITKGESSTWYQFEAIVFDSADSDTLSAEEFGMSIWVDELRVVSNDNAKRLDFGIMPSAFADPAPPSPESKIAAISVYANEIVQAGGNTYPIGDDLAPLFEASYTYGDKVSFSSFIDQDDPWFQGDPIYLHFVSTLDVPVSQVFEVSIAMDNGEVFDLQTQNVILK